jgi:putative tryptophan/tyrosine transport system substrate-binding protein
VTVTRRAFVAGSLVAIATPLAAEAQPTGVRHRIAFLGSDSPLTTMSGPNPSDVSFRAFRDGLRELGYMEGVQITIDRRSAEGDYDRLPRLARELVLANPHVIVAGAAPASLAAKAATTTLPIVSVYTEDPVTLGLVSTLARPGGNVTGLSALASGYVTKSLELLKETIPQATRIGVLGRSDLVFGIYRRDLETAAPSLGLRLEFRELVSAVGIDSHVAALASTGASALLV